MIILAHIQHVGEILSSIPKKLFTVHYILCPADSNILRYSEQMVEFVRNPLSLFIILDKNVKLLHVQHIHIRYIKYLFI